MKIAYLITRANIYGGAQVHVRDLSKWMKDHGHDVYVIGGKKGIVSDKIESQGVRYYEAISLERSINPFKDIFAFFQVRKILKEIKPDILSCHSSKAGLVGRLAARSLGIKTIFTAHGWSFTEGVSKIQSFLFRWLEWFCAFFGDHIITVSRYDKYLALKQGVANSKSMTIIHNGMPYTPPCSDKAINQILQLCMIARFSDQKDHKTLLLALSGLQHKEWHLNLVGDGDDAPYREMVKLLKIDHKVTFHGQRTDVSEFLETQDVYLLISHWEGFPRSIIEAMRASLPVITTRTAGSPEAVVQFKSGYIVPERHAKSLERAINMLISDPLRRTTMGEVGRKRYEKLFTFDEMAYKTLNVYETVLGIELSIHPQTQESYNL